MTVIGRCLNQEPAREVIFLCLPRVDCKSLAATNKALKRLIREHIGVSYPRGTFESSFLSQISGMSEYSEVQKKAALLRCFSSTSSIALARENEMVVIKLIIPRLPSLCPRLQRLEIDGRTRVLSVTDVHLQQLSDCPKLKVVVLEECQGVTESGLKALASKCGRLQTIVLKGFSSISQDSLQSLKAEFPKIDINLV